jgi:hypothetical protein
MAGTAFTGRMIMADGRLLMLIGMGTVSLLENKNLEDPSNPADWVAAEGDGRIQVDFDGAPTAKHEDYRLHHFDQGYNCNGTNLKNWLFIIPDGISTKGRTSPLTAYEKDTYMNNTNLRSGNLRSLKQPSSDACSKLCNSSVDCKAWVFEVQGANGLCFLKNDKFCVNNASDPCGGCVSRDGNCPCSAGIKAGISPTSCAKPHSTRACGRMGFASASIMGPYKFCQWLEHPHPDPQESARGNTNKAVAPGGFCSGGGPGSNCDSWPGDIIQAKDGSLYFVNGWGNLYKAAPETLSFKRLPGNATIARPSPRGSYDDLHQIEFTFLPPSKVGGRWKLYHASYASETQNPLAKEADCGYKMAIGMYSFTWDE